MKRIITVLLVAVMLAGTFAINAGAAGTLIFSDYFDTGFTPKNWITDRDACHFEWDKQFQCIQGYDSAKVLQSNFGTKGQKWWDSFYGSVDIQVRAYDDYLPEHEGRDHCMTLWYRDLMDIPDGEQEGAVYSYHVDFGTGKVTLRKEHSWDYYDANGNKQSTSTNVVIAEGQLEETIEVGEDAPWYEVGWRITSGKIECYFNQKLVMTAKADPNDPKYGLFTLNSVDESVGSKNSAFLVLNDGCWLAIDNFEIWSPDYDFNPGPAYVYGDVNSDGNVNLSDISMMLQAIAKWEIEGYTAEAGDVNGDGAVNLSDVSKTLQAIAKWEGVVLGPTA